MLPSNYLITLILKIIINQLFYLFFLLGSAPVNPVGAAATIIKSDAAKLALNLPKMTYNAYKGKGFVYPDTKYIGPGNPMDLGTPINYDDNLAYIHDNQYDELIDKGINPYFTFNEPDREMIKNARLTTPAGRATWLGINAKRVFKNDYTKTKSYRDYNFKKTLF